MATSSFLKIKRSSRSMRPSIKTDLHHVNVLKISNDDGKFHNLVRDLSKLVAGHTNHQDETFCAPVLPLLFFCDSDCSRRIYGSVLFIPSRKLFIARPMTWRRILRNLVLPVPFVLYVYFEAFLAPVEDNKESASNTKLRQLHKPSGFVCISVLQLQKFNGEIFTYSGKDCMTVFFEYVKDQDRYIHAILSDAKRMNPLTPEQHIAHAGASTCAQCSEHFNKKNKKTKHHCHLSGQYIGSYCNTCNVKLKI